MRTGSKIVGLKVFLVAAILGTVLIFSSCRPKAPYSDIKTDQTGGLAAQDNRASHEVVATMPNTPNKPVEPPSFFDAATGQVKDLPMYPGARRETLQFGPISGYENLTTRGKTPANFDVVTKYYEDVLHKFGWTIVANDRSPTNYTWQVSKGDMDLAQVAVAKGIGSDTQVYVTISRSRKEAAAAQPQSSAEPHGSK